jgi:hypothetical protein
MNLNKIQADAMTDEEREYINRIIQKWRGKCWHELAPNHNYKCLHCDEVWNQYNDAIGFYINEDDGMSPFFRGNPDYTRDLNAMHEAEMEMIEKHRGLYFDEYAENYLMFNVSASSEVRSLAMARTIKEVTNG